MHDNIQWSSIIVHTQTLSYLPQLPVKMKTTFQVWVARFLPHGNISVLKTLEINCSSSCDQKSAVRRRTCKPVTGFTTCHREDYFSHIECIGWCKLLRGTQRTIRFSYMADWSNKKVSRGQHNNPKDLREKNVMTKGWWCLLTPVTPLVIYFVAQHQPTYLLIAQIKSWSKLTYCFNAVMCMQPQIWLAVFQICFGVGANGGLALLRQTIFNQWIKQA